MFRRRVLPTLAGITLGLPVPLAVLLLGAQRADWLTHPAMVATLLFPVLTGLGALLLSEQAHRSRHARDAWRIERQSLEDRRRKLAAETAELQSLELGLLADLEEARAEVAAVQAVSTSLATALRDALHGIEGRLRGIAEDTGHAELALIGRQLEELLELVADVDHFAEHAGDGEPRAQAFPLPEIVKETLVEAKARVGGALSWTLDPEAPSWVPGRPDRLVTVLKAGVRAATRDTQGPVHLDIRLVRRGCARGLRIRWSELRDDGMEPAPTALQDLTGDLGARLSQSFSNTPVCTAGRELIWWMPETGGAPTTEPPLPAAHVLVAASDATTRARLRRLLTRWGLQVSLARTPAETLGRLGAIHVDVVLIDLEGQSLTTLESLRGHPRGRSVPVLLLGPVAENLVWLPAPDAPEALTRPVRSEGLLAGMEAALEHRGAIRVPGMDQERRRILALEPNPALAARLVRLGADVGWYVHAVSCASSLGEAARERWDLVLVEHDSARERDLATAERRLGSRVPRIGLTHTDEPHSLRDWVRTTLPFPRDTEAFLRLLAEIDPRASKEQIGDLPSAVPDDDIIQVQTPSAMADGRKVS